jgi:hypothetical protein
MVGGWSQSFNAANLEDRIGIEFLIYCIGRSIQKGEKNETVLRFQAFEQHNHPGITAWIIVPARDNPGPGKQTG